MSNPYTTTHGGRITDAQYAAMQAGVLTGINHVDALAMARAMEDNNSYLDLGSSAGGQQAALKAQFQSLVQRLRNMSGGR